MSILLRNFPFVVNSRKPFSISREDYVYNTPVKIYKYVKINIENFRKNLEEGSSLNIFIKKSKNYDIYCCNGVSDYDTIISDFKYLCDFPLSPLSFFLNDYIDFRFDTFKLENVVVDHIIFGPDFIRIIPKMDYLVYGSNHDLTENYSVRVLIFKEEDIKIEKVGDKVKFEIVISIEKLRACERINGVYFNICEISGVKLNKPKIKNNFKKLMSKQPKKIIY